MVGYYIAAHRFVDFIFFLLFDFAIIEERRKDKIQGSPFRPPVYHRVQQGFRATCVLEAAKRFCLEFGGSVLAWAESGTLCLPLGLSAIYEKVAMTEDNNKGLSEVLDRLESMLHGEEVTVDKIVSDSGTSSVPALILIFALISTSPASAIPGLTTAVAVIEFILCVQMVIGCQTIWLPTLVRRRRLSTEKLRKAIIWLRKPVAFAEKSLRPRLTLFVDPPWIHLPLILILVTTLFMPLMEMIPTTGSIASAIIALFAAGVLMRDGLLVAVSTLFLLTVPIMVWLFGFNK